MTDSNTLIAEIREDVGKGASRRLRRHGKIPAVLYGGRKDPATLTLEHDPIMHAAEQESFYSRILEIKVADGRRQKVVVRDVHRHPFKLQIMHLDFMRVSATETLKISLPIHYTGEGKSPAGRASGVVIQHLVTELEITALPENLPEYLEVDLSALDVGGVVLLSEVVLPEGVEITSLATDEENETMIANAVHIKESQGTGAAAAEEAAAAETELGVITDVDALDEDDAAPAPEAGEDEEIEN
jgi:large subunit ribosomal protein L25